MITLQPMTPAEYEPWLSAEIQAYADEKVQAGNWTVAEALERSAEEHRKLLPRGLDTPDNWLYMIMPNSAPGAEPAAVGVLWLAVPPWKPPQAFVYDFLIYEPYRRRGYARQALLALEEKVRALGLDTIGLHVFGHNHAARALYEKAGYEITNINMAKKLK
jgi:ribosomal protein S18 acetylase RimI-like enzyme